MSTERTVQTAAKINLALVVGQRQADGYHPVDTLLQTVDLGDRLTVAPDDRGRIEMTVAGPVSVEAGADNLVSRAASLLLAAAGPAVTGELPGLRLHLEKRVPAGAGLGGGSGDAAATLILVNSLLGEPLGYRRLAGLARRLGADVPFFLRGGLARGTGRGDCLRQLAPLPARGIWIGVPPLHLSTARTYARFDRFSLTSTDSPFTMRPVLEALRSGSPGGVFRNDLEQPVFEEHPQLREVKRELEARGALLAGLSGSGSALFGLFASASDLQRKLAGWTCPDGWTVFTCRTLEGPAYRGRFRLG